MAIANTMLSMKGWLICSACRQRTAITVYIQKRIDGKRKFIPFGKFCANCSKGIQFGPEADRCSRKVMKLKYKNAPKIRTKGAAV